MGALESKENRRHRYQHKPVTSFQPPPSARYEQQSDDANHDVSARTTNISSNSSNNNNNSNNNANDETNDDSSALSSAFILAGMLLKIFNSSRFDMSYVHRMAMIESIRRLVEESKKMIHQKKATTTGGEVGGYALHRKLTEIVMEGILTCNTINPIDKDTLLCDGLFDQRWDSVLLRYVYVGVPTHYVYMQQNPGVISLFEDSSYSYLNYRRLILNILRTSRYYQNLPNESRQRLKNMILKTNSYETLDVLLFRILERTCGDISTQKRIMQDIASFKYYRLLWSDRLDCHEEKNEDIGGEGKTPTTSRQSTKMMQVIDDDRKPSVTATTVTAAAKNSNYSFAYGCLVLKETTTDTATAAGSEIETCPVCLDPIEMPSLRLNCGHTFCSPCISKWITQQQQLLTSTAAVASASPSSSSSSSSCSQWHCPICRQIYERKEE